LGRSRIDTRYFQFLAVERSWRVVEMRSLSSRKVIFKFSSKNKPAYSVDFGERVVVETRDAFDSQIKTARKIFEDVDMERVNPATGPIEVRGLNSGETLCVSIEKIKCASKGLIMCSPDLGNVGSLVRRSRTKLVDIAGGKVRLGKDLVIDANPHVGVIGVSPRTGEFPTYYPGDFGGNMDTVDICERSKLYLPTYVDGGMVAIGDVHAAMGDGEVCGTGVEVAAELTVVLDRSEDLEVKRPMIETPTRWIAYAAAKTLDEAARIVTEDMVRFIASKRGVTFEDAYMLASVGANLGISQVADPLMAAKMSISKRYL
jgi:amidase